MLDLRQVTLNSKVDVREYSSSNTKSNGNAEEGESSSPFVEPVSLAEDVGVAIEEGEKNDVYNSHIQSEQKHNRLPDSQQKWPVQRVEESLCEWIGPNFNLRDVSIIAGHPSEMTTFPFEQDWSIDFWQK